MVSECCKDVILRFENFQLASLILVLVSSLLQGNAANRSCAPKKRSPTAVYLIQGFLSRWHTFFVRRRRSVVYQSLVIATVVAVIMDASISLKTAVLCVNM